MRAPNQTTLTVEDLYDAVLAAAGGVEGAERASLLHGLAGRLNGYADLLVDDPCHAAGLRVMLEVLDVVADRETVPTARLDALGPVDVADLYDMYVGPAVDGIEGLLLGHRP